MIELTDEGLTVVDAAVAANSASPTRWSGFLPIRGSTAPPADRSTCDRDDRVTEN
jgi:hypothetical protein